MGASGDGALTLWAGDYRNARFVGADLSGVRIAYGDFFYADFSDAQFGGTGIGGFGGYGYVPEEAVLFLNAKFRGADFSQGHPAGFRRATLDGGCFANTDFTGADVTGQRLPVASFSGALFADADLADAWLKGPANSIGGCD